MTSTTIKYEPLSVDKHFYEVTDLCGKWWYKSHFFKQSGIPYNVSYEQFKTLEDYGVLIGVVGRNEEGEAVSCYVGATSQFIFNDMYKQATEIVWHIQEDHRSFKALAQLMDEVEKLMDENEVKLWNLALPKDHAKTGDALKHFRYFQQDTMYMRKK